MDKGEIEGNNERRRQITLHLISCIIAAKQFYDSLIVHQFVLHLLSYDRLSKKPSLFKSFTGLSVQEFDDIYDREITKKYNKHKIQAFIQKERIEKGI